MTREEKFNLLNELLEYEENNDIGNLTRAERREFQQWISEALEQQPCEDCISREDAIMCMTGEYIADMTYKPEDIISKHIQRLRALPPVQPYNTSEWCHDCKEYNKDKHYCSRFNRVIRNTVEEMKQPKVSHWIYEKRKRLINETDEGAEYVTDYWCKCSRCGGDFGYRKMKDAFCKYCGAKMVDVPDINDGKMSEMPAGSEPQESEE